MALVFPLSSIHILMVKEWIGNIVIAGGSEDSHSNLVDFQLSLKTRLRSYTCVL